MRIFFFILGLTPSNFPNLVQLFFYGWRNMWTAPNEGICALWSHPAQIRSSLTINQEALPTDQLTYPCTRSLIFRIFNIAICNWRARAECSRDKPQSDLAKIQVHVHIWCAIYQGYNQGWLSSIVLSHKVWLPMIAGDICSAKPQAATNILIYPNCGNGAAD